MAMTLDSLAKLIADGEERRASEMRELRSSLSTELDSIKVAVDTFKPELESMDAQASPPSAGWDWDGMTPEEQSRIEQKLDMLVEVVKSCYTYPSTTPAAPTAAGIVCHSEATTVALPTAFGGLTYTPDSSASPSSSSGIPNADLAVAIDASNLTVFAPAKCSTEGPSSDACESRSPSVSATAPTPPSGTVDIISVLASTAESEEALDGDAVTGAVSMCSADGMQHGTREETPKAGALLFEAIPGWQSSSARALPRFVMKISEEVIFELTLASNTSDNVSPYAESLHAPCERVWLLHVPHCPPDAPDCTRGLFSSLQPYLPAPVPKPPWLLLVRELILRKEELEERENYASDNLTNEGKEVLKTGSRSWQLKPPWLSFRLVSCATVMSHLIWERSKKCDPNGLVQSIVAAPELHMPWFIANLSNTPTCDTFSELYSTTGTWYFNDEISSVMQWISGIQEVQRVSVFLDTSFGSRSCVTGITMQNSDACPVLISLSSCYAPLPVENILEDSNMYVVRVLLFYSADGKVHHIMLQPKGVEIHQPENVLHIRFCKRNIRFITQPEKYVSLFLQPNPSRLFLLTQPDTHVEEKGVCSRGEVMTRSSISILAVLESYVRQLIGDTLDHHSKLGSVIFGDLIIWPQFSKFRPGEAYSLLACKKHHYMGSFHCLILAISEVPAVTSAEPLQCLASYLFGECFSNNNNTFGSDLSSISSHSEISWVPILVDKADLHLRSLWDPGGCMFAFCSGEECWTLSEFPSLHCSDQIRWLSSIESVIESSACYVPTPPHGMKNVTRQAVFSNTVHVGHDYYIALVNKISISYDYYLDEVFYLDKVCSDLLYYCKDYNHDLAKIKEVHAPWDPGESALRYPSKTSAWGQADFQEGGNVMTLAWRSIIGLISSWASSDGPGPTDQVRQAQLHIGIEKHRNNHPVGSRRTERLLCLLPPLYSPPPTSDSL